MSNQQTILAPSDYNHTPKKDSHQQNDNWEWSKSVTEFVASHITGRSLKICPGLQPIADVNLDIKRLDEIAESENADFTIEQLSAKEDIPQPILSALRDGFQSDTLYGSIKPTTETTSNLYTGYACQGDMFDLPFEDNTFDTTIADPPWLDLSTSERADLLREAVRVTRPTGSIIYNATWTPTDQDHTRVYKTRFRQQRDFWGGSSFITFYKREARSIAELFERFDYESEERYPEDSPWWSEAYHPNALSTAHNTDPKIVSREYSHYCCPMCGCSQLGQLRGEYHETSDGEFNTYECSNCNFRVTKQEVTQLAEALEKAANTRDIKISDVETVNHTPECVKHAGSLISDSLPWNPNTTYSTNGTNETLSTYTMAE